MLVSKNEKSWKEDSSWLWHQDDYLHGSHLKMFCYLNDVTNDNGAFQFHNSINSKRYIRQGFKGSYPERKFNNKFILEKLNKNFNSVEGNKGTIFLCDVNSIIHKANMPKVGKREAIVFEMAPCIKPKNTHKLEGFSFRSMYIKTFQALKFIYNHS